MIHNHISVNDLYTEKPSTPQNYTVLFGNDIYSHEIIEFGLTTGICNSIPHRLHFNVQKIDTNEAIR